MNKSVNPEERLGRWRTFGYVLLFFAGYALLVGVEASGTLTAILPQRWQQILSSGELLFFGTLTSLGAMGLTLLAARWENIGLEDVGVNFDRRSLSKFALGFLTGLALGGMNLAISYAVAGTRWVWEPGASLGGATLVVFGFVAGSCGEELGFRGYPLRRLERAFRLGVAQAIVATAFVLYHAAVGWPWANAVVGAGTGSLLFGMAAIASRGLAVPIGLHAAWNFVDWSVGGKGSGGLWKPTTAQSKSLFVASEAGFLTVAALGIWIFWQWHRRNLQRESLA